MLGAMWATSKPKGLRKLVISSSPASMPLWVESCEAWKNELPQNISDAIDHGEKDEDYGSDAYLEVSFLDSMCILARVFRSFTGFSATRESVC